MNKMIVWSVILTALLTAVVNGQPCPEVCTCTGRPDADKFKVDCSDADVESIASLNIPSHTTQL